MLEFPQKRIYCLIGIPRSGKDTVAKYLQESRNFEVFAFADKIKEEFGITKEDFEAAKITGDIEKLRRDLWEFSKEKTKNNPLYFIDKVITAAYFTVKSVVITDIRTTIEYSQALYGIQKYKAIRKAFWIIKGNIADQFDQEDMLKDSKISKQFLENLNSEIFKIHNKNNALHRFLSDLERCFLTEDILELHKKSYSRDDIGAYLEKFIISER